MTNAIMSSPDLLTVATARLRTEQRYSLESWPRVDYVQLLHQIESGLLDYDVYDTGRVGKQLRRLETRLRSDVYFATVVARRGRSSKHKAIFAMSERVGLPLAVLKRAGLLRPKLITLFTCWSPRQEKALRTLGLHRAMDLILVQCSSMIETLTAVGVPRHKLRMVGYGIDSHFFRPIPCVSPIRNQVFTLGEARSRDYKTLFEAVSNTSINLTVADAGYWYAREKHLGVQSGVPENITFTGRLDPSALRNHYAQSSIVALPVYPAPFSAGLTATMEAMAMGRPVVATDSPGLRDLITHNETGILIPSGDIKAWRDALCDLLDNPKKAAAIGRRAYESVVDKIELDSYVIRLMEALKGAI